MDAEKILYKEDIKRLEEVHEREMHEHSQALDNVSKLQLVIFANFFSDNRMCVL